MKKDKQRVLLTFLLGVLILVSCDKNRVFESNIEIPSYQWNKDSILLFHVDIVDTISSHNIFLNVRNTSQYAYQNLFVFLNTTSPTGISLRDTLECYLADDRGKWLGDGWGDIYDNRFLYKRNVRFPVSGIYTFKLVQGMRANELKYITDVGIRIEKVENQ